MQSFDIEPQAAVDAAFELIALVGIIRQIFKY